MTDKPAIGFIGLGNMGWPMAASLVRAGYPLQVHDSRREVAEDFARRHRAVVPGSVRTLASASEVLVTMLPTSGVVQQVVATGADTVLAGMRPGAIVVEMSSGVPSV